MDKGYKVLLWTDGSEDNPQVQLANEYPVGTDIRVCIDEAEKVLSQNQPEGIRTEIVRFNQLTGLVDIIWNSDIESKTLKYGLWIQELRNIQDDLNTLKLSTEIMRERGQIGKPGRIILETIETEVERIFNRIEKSIQSKLERTDG